MVKEEIEATLRSVGAEVGAVVRLAGSREGAVRNRAVQCEEEVGGCRALIEELGRAVAVSAANPARFRLDAGEVGRREEFVRWARGQADSLEAQLAGPEVQEAKRREGGAEQQRGSRGAFAESRHGGAGGAQGAASAALFAGAAPPGGGPGISGARDGDAQGGGSRALHDDLYGQQQQLFRSQDEELDDLSLGIARLGEVGLTISRELDEQSGLLGDLDGDLDGLGGRMGAAQAKMVKLIKESKKTQYCLILFLAVLFIFLATIAFS